MAELKFPLGWIEPEKRSFAGKKSHEAAVAKMPFFSMLPMGKPEVGFKILLTDLWSHPRVVEAIGSNFLGWYQYTGSCVGVGGGNVLFTTCCVDILKNNEAEHIVVPFWPFNYGRSRTLGGMNGQGEGSFGSTFAQSCTEDGSPGWKIEKGLILPDYKITGNGYEIGKAMELKYSDSRNSGSDIIQAGKETLIRTTSELKSGEQVRDSIINGYPVTRAFDKFVNPETQQIRNGVATGRYNGRGGHQEAWLGYWNHPQEGELIWEQNQWGLNIYGVDPGGGPKGGVWIRLEDVDRECKGQYAEIYAFSQYEGYPAQPEVYDWTKQSFFS